MKIYSFIRNACFSLWAKQTVGVRALIIQNEKVLLVKHTYLPQWYTVGGGIDSKEVPLQALARELKEEVGAILIAPPKLFAVYYSDTQARDDYIIFYIVENCQFEANNSLEISAKKWFSLTDLPADISPATQRRIDEYLGKIPITDKW